MSNIVTCRSCGTTLRVADQLSSRDVCPQCLSALVEPEPEQRPEPGGRLRAPNLVRDVRRDSRVTSWILWVLIGLVAAGVILATVQMRSAKGEEAISGMQCMMVGFVALDVLLWIAGLGRLARWIFRGPNANSTIRAVAYAFLILAMGAAIFVFFFTVCVVLLQGK
jgi:hypothetical protein